MEDHGPEISRKQTNKKKCPWFCNNTHIKCQAKRQAERKWCRSLLDIDRQMYVEAHVASKRCLDACKTQYYNTPFTMADQRQRSKLWTVCLRQIPWYFAYSQSHRTIMQCLCTLSHCKDWENPERHTKTDSGWTVGTTIKCPETTPISHYHNKDLQMWMKSEN